MLRVNGKRTALALAATVAAVGVGTAVSQPASASTIPDGQIQICAQGDYSAAVNVLPRDLGDGTWVAGLNFMVNPGECRVESFDTYGGASQVDVVGWTPDGTQFTVGTQWWSSNTGLGLGAEGSSWAPYLWQW